ncbi:hypothetical protein HW555_009953, partial [Spodoptera exigua]
VLKKLKDIPFKIQTASLKERREVVEEIRNVLSTPGITEPAVRFVCRLLVLTLHRYRDSTSQSYIKSLVAYLATTHREWTLKALLPVLLEISEQLKNTASSKSICQSGLYALRWSTVLIEGAIKASEENGVDYNTLVISQANLLAAITAYGDHRKSDKAYSMLHTTWVTIGKAKLSKWIEVLLATPPDSGPQICVTFSILCRHLQQIGEGETIEKHKSIISVKSRPNANYIKGCHDLLSQLNSGDVRDALLPALHKAMLRSPETIVQAVGQVFASLNVELDGLAVDIGKSLIASGKLTSSEDKIAVLNGVGCLRALPVHGAERVALFNEVASQLARVLDSESHERTLCVALDTLQRWTAGLGTTLPDKLLDIFKKNLSAKSTTQAVRTMYMSMVAAGVRACGASPAQAAALQPVLSKAVDKAAQQPLQHLVVSEGICAMLGLVQLEAGGSGQWAALAHVLLHDRVLAAAGDEGGVAMQNSVGKLPKCCQRTKLAGLQSIRVIEEVKALLAKEDRVLIARNLALKLNEVLEEGKVFSGKEKTPTDEKGAGEVTGKMILDCVQALCSFK